MDGLAELLPYLLPPITGALIGYVTNYIAIRMIFRPLRAWHVFGFRVPFTPGLIPAQRERFASRLGRTVGTRLLSPADVRRALEKPSFQAELRTAVDARLDAILKTELGSLQALVPGELHQRFRELFDAVTDRLVQAVFAFVESEAFADRIRCYLVDRQAALLDATLSASVPCETLTAVRTEIQQRVLAGLRSETLADLAGRFADEQVDRLQQSETRLADLLPPGAAAMIEQEILSGLSRLLKDPQVQARLSARGRASLAEFVDSLHGVSGLLAKFVDLDYIYLRLPGLLDRIAEELAYEESTRRQVAELIGTQLDRLLEQPICVLIARLPPDAIGDLRRVLRDESVKWLHGHETAEIVGRALEAGLARIHDEPLRRLLAPLIPDLALARAPEAVADRILAELRSPAVRALVRRLVEEKITDVLWHRHHGELATYLPDAVAIELKAIASAQLLELLRKEVPVFIATLDIERMVEDKVLSLDIAEVEMILLDIMRRHFLYINLVGGAIGFVIGLLNVLWYTFRP